MLHKLRQRAEDEQGFTLIELLVVILIIGILAAIAIPAFLNQRGKAYDSQAKSNVNTARVAEETYATDNNGSYVTATTSAAGTDALSTIEPTLKSSPFVTATASGSTYTLVSTSAGATPVTYSLTNSSGTVTRACAPASTGGCNGSSTW